MAPTSTPVPMIRRVRLKNFRSIAECDVELGPLTILVGPNGSGKSNFLHALDFLSDALNNGLETAVRRRGGMNSLLSRWAADDPDAILAVEVTLELSDHRRGVYLLELRRKKADQLSTSGGYELSREWCVIETNTGRNDGKLAEFRVAPGGSEWWDVRGSDFIPRIFPSLGPPALTLPHVSEHLNFGLVYRAIKGVTCYSLHVSEMRKPHEHDGGEILNPDGSNLASVIDRMLERTTYGTVPAERLIDWIRVITPGIVAVRPANVSGYVTLQVDQLPANQFDQHQDTDEAAWTFDAPELSYGTLRTLGVLVALYQGRMRDVSPITLVGIEEPESAVHPGAAAALLEAMVEASLVTQVLATTHSAAMLDYEDLEPDILRAVVRENGRTRIGPIDAAGRQILEESLFTAGELLEMSNLEPEVSDDATPREETAASPV